MSTLDDSVPVRLIQWGPSDEPDELNQIQKQLAARLPQGLHPASRSVRVTTPSVSKFLSALRGCLRGVAPENRQVIYISAHGDTTRFGFGAEGYLTYQALGKELETLLDGSSDLSLVFGSCESMADDATMLENLPSQVSLAYGFVACPTDADVAALMTAVLYEDARLWQQLHAANMRVFGSGVSEAGLTNAIAQLQSMWDTILDGFTPDPTRFVKGKDGLAVRRAHRVAGKWKIDTLVLRT